MCTRNAISKFSICALMGYQLVDAEDWNEIRERQQKNFLPLKIQTIFSSSSKQTFMLIVLTWLDFLFYVLAILLFWWNNFLFLATDRVHAYHRRNDKSHCFYLNKLHCDTFATRNQWEFFFVDRRNFQFGFFHPFWLFSFSRL